METQIVFNSDNLLLEGALYRTPGNKGAIITHPHSLYGGDMHNHVVKAICQAFIKKGYSTLRFNFRGVGASGGRFDNGCGEGRDVSGAIQYMISSGIDLISLAGYSFGSRVLAEVDIPPEVKEQIYVSPPVGFMDFSTISSIKRLRRVVTGGDDEIAPYTEIRKYLPLWNSTAELHVIEGGDHFFNNAMARFTSVLEEVIT